MKDGERFPLEIIQFLKNPGGHSLIVKGLPGTGKTTFALQLIEELGATTSSYYLSTRVSDASLFHQFHWLKGLLKKNKLLKVGGIYSKIIHSEKLHEEDFDISVDTNVRTGKHPLKGPEEKDKVRREELKKLEGRIEMGDVGIEDKVGEIEGDTITFDLGSDLPEMDTIYDAVDSWKPQKSLVVLDSVDALSETYGIGASRLMNTLQKDLVENSGTNLLFVLEASTETALDYLGDGVIHLSTGEHEARRIRMMTVEKLRGAEIKHPNYLYTLNEGRLMVFGYEHTETLKEAKKWEYVPDISEDMVSTGNEDIDRLIGGGFQKGSIIAVEIDLNVPYKYTDMLKTGLLCNFATQKRGVFTVASMKATSEVVMDVLKPHLDLELFENNIRIFETISKVFDASPVEDTESSKISYPVEGSDVETELKWRNIEFSLEKAKKPFLSMVGFDTLESVYGPDVIEDLTDHLTFIRKGGHIFLGFLTPTTKSTQKLISMSHVHIKIQNVNGAILIYTQKPYTELHFLSFDYSSGFPKAHLIPIL